MARIARVVAPGMSHHITQRGNRRQQTFFTDDDNLVKVMPLLELINDWKSFLSDIVQEQEMKLFQRHERTGRPLGGAAFNRED